LATVTVGQDFYADMSSIQIGDLMEGEAVIANSTTYVLDFGLGLRATFLGSGFSYNSLMTPQSGIVTRYQESIDGEVGVDIAGLSVPATTLVSWAATNYQNAVSDLLAGADQIQGAGYDDVLLGFGGADSMVGGAGNDVLDVGTGGDTAFGGAGNDTLGSSGSEYNYLWAEDGNDSIWGGSGFDNTHGNQGNDTTHGNAGADWVVGGKGEDLMYGDAGVDLVYGNIGNDSLYGGDDADRLLGGQDSDTLSGGAGNDFLSGDRGSDTVGGGAGADIFYGFDGTGVDRITDFDYAEGDRIQLFQTDLQSASVVGSDTVLSFGAGNQLILVGITTALPADFLLLA
jgi:serralysin